MSGATAPTVLVVDDDKEIRETLAQLLEEEGYSILTAENGAEALDVLSRTRPDIILLDLMMPVMDGESFRLAMCRTPEWTSIPVLILSADHSLRRKAESLKVAGYLKKPIELSDLMMAIEQHRPATAV